jgi:hypothetical protein
MKKIFLFIFVFTLNSFAQGQELSFPLVIDKKALDKLPTLEDVKWCFKSAGYSTQVLAYDGLNHKLVMENDNGDVSIFRKNNVVLVKTENVTSGSSAKTGVSCLPLGEQRANDYFTQLGVGLKQLKWARTDDKAPLLEKCNYLIKQFGGVPSQTDIRETVPSSQSRPAVR